MEIHVYLETEDPSQNNQGCCQNNLINNLVATRQSRVCKGTPESTFPLRQNVDVPFPCSPYCTVFSISLGKMGLNSQVEIQKSWRAEAMITHCYKLPWGDIEVYLWLSSCMLHKSVTCHARQGTFPHRSRRENVPEGFLGWCGCVSGRYRSLWVFQVLPSWLAEWT